MAYKKTKRPYKKEYEQQQARGEHPDRMERQRARRDMDKTGVDANKNGKADKREGKDVAHRKPLSRGGTNKDGVTVQSRTRNRAAGGALSKGTKSKGTKRKTKKV
jgi:hypothetical protein|tara:strand:+ start:5412 stop:5726 length:315 start_codon:yes stop_codon:yes gene_type:complete